MATVQPEITPVTILAILPELPPDSGTAVRCNGCSDRFDANASERVGDLTLWPAAQTMAGFAGGPLRAIGKSLREAVPGTRVRALPAGALKHVRDH